ncbi:MAG: hypothetical protein QM726_04380 [Chitinophagaceae bacterium]
MITNVPNQSDFEQVAKENLTQSFTLLFRVYESFIQRDEQELSDEVSNEELWKYNTGTVRTSLILVHQALEGLMKSEICKESPLLLVDKPKKDWPSLPNSENKDFDSLYTIGGEALLNTFCAINTHIVKDAPLIEFIEDVRLKRNQAVHGTGTPDVSPQFILNSILKTFTIWFGKDYWHKQLKQNIYDNPLFGYFDDEFESALSFKFLDFAKIIIGKNELSKHLSVNIHSRAYFCPACKRNLENNYEELKSKWAFLVPNKPNSTNVVCTNCEQSFTVYRMDCGIGDCKGNVLYDDTEDEGTRVCLTCFEYHEIEE